MLIVFRLFISCYMLVISFTENWFLWTRRSYHPTTQKMKFSIKDFFSIYDQNPQFQADLVTFTEEILNGLLRNSFQIRFQYGYDK